MLITLSYNDLLIGDIVVVVLEPPFTIGEFSFNDKRSCNCFSSSSKPPTFLINVISSLITSGSSSSRASLNFESMALLPALVRDGCSSSSSSSSSYSISSSGCSVVVVLGFPMKILFTVVDLDVAVGVLKQEFHLIAAEDDYFRYFTYDSVVTVFGFVHSTFRV